MRSSQRASLLFWPGLLLIGLVGLGIRLYAGQHEMLSYDEWQHVFIASGARLTDMFYEIRTNAHPALFFLLLRGLLKLGHAKLLYRAISISAGVASILLVGLISRKTLRSPILQLLSAAAFALSGSAVIMSIQVRSYELAIALVLLAFLSYLDMIPAPEKPVPLRPYVWFTIASTLAVWSHYCVIFFLGACLAVPFVLAAASGEFRRRFISGLDRKTIGLSVLSFALPCAVFALHLGHISGQVIQGYLYDFYWQMTPNGAETAGAFAVRNCRNLFNLFSPVRLSSTTAFLVTLAVGGVAGMIVLVKASRAQRTRVASGVSIAFAAVMIAELLAASLAQRYPFGGLLRHQYIVAPFLLLAAFVFLDALASVAGPIATRGLAILLGAAIVANPAYDWQKVIEFPDHVVLEHEFAAYSAAFPRARAVYLDSFTVWGYFVHTDDGRRSFVRRISDSAWIDEYRIRGGAHDGTLIFYDKSRYQIHFFDSSLYESLAACLRQSGVGEVTLFWFSPGGEPLVEAPSDLEKDIRTDAAAQGLTTTKLVVTRVAVFGGFRLAAAGP